MPRRTDPQPAAVAVLKPLPRPKRPVAVPGEAGQGDLPFDVVAAKIRISALPAKTVSRTALVNRLRADRSARVVAVVAPAGYGKTTLLAQWAARDGRRFAWVSLDRRDNDPLTFLRHVAAALDAVGEVDHRALEALAAPAKSVWPRIVPRVAAMIGRAEDCVLVLDGAHALTDGASVEVLAALAEHVPQGSALVLSGRTEPALVPARRLDGSLVELGADDLALTRREAGLLLRRAGAAISDEDLGELLVKTEGWAAALTFASLPPEAAAAELGEVFGGADEHFAAYLHAECLGELPAEQVTFLRRSSVLETFCGGLCDAALDRKHSAGEIEAIKKANLFLIPLDLHGEWFRYHPMFRELLRRELEETEPELVEPLRRRAADWYESRGEREAALEYALAAGERDRPARILAEIAVPACDGGRSAVVARWLACFDAEGLLERYPALALVGARIQLLSGHAHDAERWLAEAEKSGDDPALAAQIQIVRAAMCRDGAAQMLVDVQAGLAALPEDSQWRSAGLLVHAAAQVLHGDNERADAIFQEAVDLAARTGLSEPQVIGTSERVLLAEEAHDLASADRRVAELSGLVASGALDASPPCAIELAATARAQLRHGNWDQARTLLRQAQQLTPFLTDAIPWLAVQTRLELARTFLALRDVTAARALLAETDDIFARRPGLGVLADQAESLREAIAAVPALENGRDSGLTAAEMRLLPLLTTHLSFREIGERVFLSRNTIKTQAISVYRKLGVSTRSEAIEEAVRLGLVDDVAPARGGTPSG